MEHKSRCKREIRLRGLDSKLEPRSWCQGAQGEASEAPQRAHI